MRIAPYLKSGYIKRGETIAELATACGLDAKQMQATVSRFNVHAVRGEDPEFHRGTDAYQRFNGAAKYANPCLASLDQPRRSMPYAVPAELGTFAGIATNANAQVLDKSGRAIPGLYAVGNDAASVMGGTYPGAGITIGPAMTFGYIAGKHLAQ